MIGMFGGSGSSTETTTRNQISNSSEVVENTSEISFSETENVTLETGETYSSGEAQDKVIVSQPDEAESISLDSDNNIVPEEEAQVIANVFPDTAENEDISRMSSDESVAADGSAESFEQNAGGTKRTMSLRVTHPRDDDNNIGNEWSYITQVNGEKAGGEYLISAGDTLSFNAEFREDDKNPDVGKASTSYTVTEEDLINGFTVSMDLYVTENGGRNSGKSAHFIVNYNYTAK